MKLTLQECRDQLYNAAVPSLTGSTNGVPNRDIFDQTLNFALERIINEGSWLGVYEHVAFLIPEGEHYLTLPPEYAAIEALAYEHRGENGCVCKMPVQIKNEWLTVLAPGPFLWNQSLWGNFGFYAYNAYAYDRGDGFILFRDSPFTSYKLKFVLDSAEDDNQVVLIKGYDGDGEKIFTPSSSSAYEGIEFTMNYPSVTPSQVFTKQPYFLHKEMFQGYLKIYAVDEDTAEEYLVGSYQPNMVNADLKRYGIPNCNLNTEFTVRSICKRRFVPVFHGTDSVYPSNLGALRTAITAIKYEAQNDPGRRDTEMAKAIELLNNELRSFRGGAAMKLRIDPNAFQFQNLYQGR
jgi:hypothetical protein